MTDRLLRRRKTDPPAARRPGLIAPLVVGDPSSLSAWPGLLADHGAKPAGQRRIVQADGGKLAGSRRAPMPDDLRRYHWQRISNPQTGRV
jgi:hypothetical protein